MSTFLRNHNFDVLSSGEMNEKNWQDNRGKFLKLTLGNP
jgi:hypothetical protein